LSTLRKDTCVQLERGCERSRIVTNWQTDWRNMTSVTWSRQCL